MGSISFGYPYLGVIVEDPLDVIDVVVLRALGLWHCADPKVSSNRGLVGGYYHVISLACPFKVSDFL
jgi:hypothetical protein